jgi:hypothetical protein
MTIEVAFHESDYRPFKDFYFRYVTPHLRATSPRFAELGERAGRILNRNTEHSYTLSYRLAGVSV